MAAALWVHHDEVMAADSELLTVTSADGTDLACWRVGTGPPVVVVHGTTASHAAWSRVAKLLEPAFTVYTFDRRGRGASGDGPHYALEREVEDVRAVVSATGAPAHLLGHSFGGMVALEAAPVVREAGVLSSLILYEPITAGEPTPADVIDRLEAAIDAGEHEQALATFLRERTGMTAHDVELARASALWSARVEAAPTIARELRAHAGYRPDWERLAGIDVPTLLLLGSDSGRYAAGAQALAEALTAVTVCTLEGQGHAAHLTAPRQLVKAVTAFLDA